MPVPHYSLLHPHDAQWKELLNKVEHDFYHLCEYGEIAGQQEGAQSRALLIQRGEDIALVPLLIRSVPAAIDTCGNLTDGISPYGYASPLIYSHSSNFLRDLPDLIREGAREFNLVSVFLRWHPFISEQHQQLAKSTKTGSVVWLDLEQSLAISYSKIRSAHRRSIERLERLGYSTRVIAGQCLDQTVIESFLGLYYQTMNRVQARRYYFFPPSYFAKFFNLLAPAIQVLEVVSPDERVVSSLLLVTYGRFAHYHLSGTDNQALRLSPLKFAIWKAAEFSKARGCSLLCLGGGVGARQDNLFQFKLGFSNLLKPFYTGGLVCSRHYEELNFKAQIIRGAPPDSPFFPEYRSLPDPIPAPTPT